MKNLNRKRLLVAPLVVSLVSFTIPQVHADDFGAVCSNIPAGATMTASAESNSQKSSYCASAKQSKSAHDKENVLFGLYAATSAVCLAVCWADIFGGAGDVVCSASAVGTGVADMVMTKQFTNSFTTLLNGFALYKAYEAMETADAAGVTAITHATTDVAGTKIKTCYIEAAMAGVSAVMHKSSANSAKNAYNQNLANARTLNNTNTNSYSLVAAQPGSFAATASGGGSVSSVATTGGNSSSSVGAGGCGDTSTVAGAISCAATADSTLAQNVASPAFQKAFQKVSGMSLGDYLSKTSGMSPSAAVDAALGGLGNTDTAKIDEAYAAAEKAMPIGFDPSAGGAYAGGGAKKSSGGSGDDELASLMKGLMNQVGGAKDDASGKKGVSEVNFGAAKRSLASVRAEDPSVSLFDRVAFRYASVVPRLLSSEPSSARTLKDWSESVPATH